MLDGFIIEELRRREREKRERESARRPRLEIPVPEPPVIRRDRPSEEDDESGDNVIIIDMV